MARLRSALAVLALVATVFAGSHPARAALSGEMQGAIADMVNSAIATEDAQALSAAIDDLCAAHPDIKEQIVAAVASELAARRPPGYCIGRGEPCLDLDSIMDTLLVNMLARYETASGEPRQSARRRTFIEDSTGECGGGNCATEPPLSSSASPVRR